MIRTWKITNSQADEIHFEDESSLDAITRQLPDGFYSTFRTYDSCTRVIGLSAHLKRLPHIDASTLRRSLIQLLEPYRPPFGLRARRGETADEARVRVMETRDREFYISIEPLKLLPPEVYDKGVKVETTTLERRDPRIKSTAFIARSNEERKHIAQEGIFEALLVKNGKILEGMTSNFFYISRAPERASGLRERRTKSTDDAHLQPGASSAFVAMDAPHSAQGEVLLTARNDILLGVTRTVVIRAARGRGVDVRYSPLKLNQLSAVKEAFITSSSRGVVPVTQIDDAIVGQGSPGKITKMLMQAYEEYVRRHAELI